MLTLNISLRFHRTLRVVDPAVWQVETDDDSPIMGRNGAVSSGNTAANQAALDILKAGGNAVDAAIAAALVIGVRNSFASGIGGGGVMLIHLPNGTDFTIDCREVAPASFHQDIYKSNPILSQRAGLSMGIPGELLCMEQAWRGYGKTAWKNLFTAAISSARNGFTVNSLLAFRLASNATLIANDPGLSSVFMNGTVPLKEGDTVYMTKLADTLTTISQYGVSAFYNGSLTSTVLSEMNGFGANVTASDLSQYSVDYNGVYSTTYKNLRVVGAPLPFAGSLMMMQSLNIIETFDLAKAQGYDTEALHIIIEASKFGFGYRPMLGDAKFSNLTGVVGRMLSKTNAQKVIAPKISPTGTLPRLGYTEDDTDIRSKKRVWPHNDQGTTHVSVFDKNKMAVAFTTSINWSFGSGCLGNSTGIIYNNQMDDFSQPDVKDAGFPQDPTNFPAAFKRPLSSITPTLVYDSDNRIVFIAGGSGGPKIFTGTLFSFLNVFEFGYNVKESAKLPRFHNGLTPDSLLYESFTDEDIVNGLKLLGHNMKSESVPFNAINVIQVKYSSTGNITLEADSDWRKDAESKAYKRQAVASHSWF